MGILSICLYYYRDTLAHGMVYNSPFAYLYILLRLFTWANHAIPLFPTPYHSSLHYVISSVPAFLKILPPLSRHHFLFFFTILLLVSVYFLVVSFVFRFNSILFITFLITLTCLFSHGGGRGRFLSLVSSLIFPLSLYFFLQVKCPLSFFAIFVYCFL